MSFPMSPQAKCPKCKRWIEVGVHNREGMEPVFLLTCAPCDLGWNFEPSYLSDFLEKVKRAAVEEEREACAKVCESGELKADVMPAEHVEFIREFPLEASKTLVGVVKERLAAVIRERGKA